MAYGFTYTLPTITGSHSNMPILLKGDDFPSGAIDGTANAIDNGGGNLIAYADDTKVTRLALEVVNFVSSGTPSAEVWVKVPTAATGNSIYLEADDSQTVQPAVTTATHGRNALWSDYAAVFHLDGDAVDSSGNLSDGTINGATSTTGGYDFDGVNDYISADFSTFTPTLLHISSWVRPDTVRWAAISSKGSGADSDWGLWTDGGNPALLFKTGANSLFVGVSADISTGVNSHIVADYDGSNQKVYLNGAQLGSSSAYTGGIPNTADTHNIGAKYSVDADWWDGFIGFVKIMDGTRSANWIATESSNTSASTAWGTVGTWDIAAAPSAAISSVGGDDVVVDAELNAAFVTSGFSSEISTVQLVSGTSITNATGVTSTSGTGTFNLPDVSLYATPTVGAPLSTTNNVVVARLTDA